VSSVLLERAIKKSKLKIPMLEQDLIEKIIEPAQEPEALTALKQSVEASLDAAMICESKKHNPNFFSVIFANKKFYETFELDEFELMGKNYDFLFADLDLDYYSEDQLEYVRLIKAVKAFDSCSIILMLSDIALGEVKYKITFIPSDFTDLAGHRHAVFSFQKMEIEEATKQREEKNSANLGLLKNLERTLYNERLLREVSYLIISDLPIDEIAQKIAKILGEHLKADRCLLHDYKNANTSFVTEYHNNYTQPMFKDVHDEEGLKILAKYINFQNHFYERYGDNDKNSSLVVVEDVAVDNNFNPIRDIFEKFSIASQIAVTTSFNGKVNGGIYIHQSDRKNWLTDEIELVEMIADQFSIAVDRSDSIERVMVANHSLIEKTSQLKEALENEQEMRKMQSEFVALVSHEFKTPLQIIDSTRELLTRKIKNHNIIDESIDKALERIKSGISRMNGLIHSTLNLARMENGENKIKVEYETFDLKKFIFDIIEKNSNLAMNKNIQILTSIDELPSDFYGDSKLLDHSITNIISNAVKYSKNDTTVRILAKANDKKVALRVIDQGMGIPKEDLANIGQKFFRAKNTLSVAGTGIGIYLTKHFVQLHGGDVTIDSEINVGTTVTVTLPRVSKDQL
jgi:signal transduction histidine kinase